LIKLNLLEKNLLIKNIIDTQDILGGIKETTPSFLKEKNKTEEILKLAVKRMLPGGPLAKKQLTKLKIYNGDKHPHDVQKPKIIDFEKLIKEILLNNGTD
jgi:large subunit ribosomal protein L13